MPSRCKVFGCLRLNPLNGYVQAEALKADAANADEIREIVQKVVNRFGNLDILVNNAAIYPTGLLQDTSDEEFEQTVNVNIRAVFLAVREAAKGV